MQSLRNFLKRSVIVASATAFVALAGPSSHAADSQNIKAAEAAKDLTSALAVLGVQTPGPGKRILLDVPEIVDEKQKVTIKVKSTIPNTDWIAVLVEKNATPFVGQFDLTGKTNSIEVTAKLLQTSSVVAIVRADGKYYRVDKEVKVAVAGGCE